METRSGRRTPRLARGQLAGALLDWFRQHRRSLPWRGSSNPYQIWVAEVLLQQTRVAQAIPFYTRFLARFPTVGALARASEGDVLKVWEGAGYYARARNLLRAAGHVVREHRGVVPSRVSDLERLPGVGKYTAAAVASLAYGKRVLALEANGLRVGARLTLETGDLRSERVRARLRQFLTDHLPQRDPGRFNEALMELGETVCLPKKPLCEVCPIARLCRARQELPYPGSIPVLQPRPPRPHVVASVISVESHGRWLIHRRPSSGLLGGLWEFPGGKLELGESVREAAQRELWEETGLRLEPMTKVGVIRHAYSHFSVELHVFRAETDDPPHQIGRDGRWVTRTEFNRLAKPKATEKIIALLMRPKPPAQSRASPDSESRPDRKRP